MRAPLSVAIAVVATSHLTAAAQAPAPDFSGVYVAPIYVAVPDVTEPDVMPYTPAGRAAAGSYDVFADAPNQSDDCAAERFPAILWTGDPMEIVQEQDRIVMRYERVATVRTIHMGGASPRADQPPTVLGYSVGRWVGDQELQIETTHMESGVIRSNQGYPMSAQARVTERYWREPGEQDLRLEFVVHDPVYYTEPVTFARGWVWAPDDQVREWGCVDLGPRGSEQPDIDELVRMLEEL